MRNGTDSSRELRMNSRKNIMTRTEVADYLRVDKSTVSRLAKSGEISCFKIGTRLLFKSSDVLTFIENRIVCEVDEFRGGYK